MFVVDTILSVQVAEQYLDIIDNIQQVHAGVIQESEKQSDTSLSSRLGQLIYYTTNYTDVVIYLVQGN